MLALGIGSSTAVFSVLYEALLKPLPYPDANRIVFVFNSFPKSQLSRGSLSAPDYAEVSRQHDVFSQAGVYYFNDFTMTGAGAARHVDAVNASASLFELLGVKPALGRTITSDDDRDSAPKVALLSDTFWRSAFDARPDVLGRTIELNGDAYTIVGVMPRAFHYPYPATQLWVPVALKAGYFAESQRGDKWLQTLARLAPGVNQQQAQSTLLAIGHRLARAYPSFYPEKEGWRFITEPLIEEQTRAIRRWLFLGFGAVLCVLLIACSNVSGLLLIRSTARSSELAIRAALGAAGHRIARQILTETAVLVFAGCAAGIFLAGWAIELINRYGPIAQTAHIQIWTIVFAIAMALLSTFAAGLLPAVASRRVPIEQGLKSGSTRTMTGAVGWRYLAVAAQIGVAVALLFTATLLSRSFIKLMQVAPGFSADHVWTGTVSLPSKSYKDGDRAAAFFKEVQQRLAALPGVELASASAGLPFNPSGGWISDLYFPGRAEGPVRPAARENLVLPGYFEAMKIPLLRGRTFTPNDNEHGERVAIVDEDFVKLYFHGEDPIGKMVANNALRDKAARIAGVVSDVDTDQLGGAHKPEIYWPVPQRHISAMYLAVRTKGAIDITSAVREQVAQVDRHVALFDVATMTERIAQSLKLRRFIAVLLNGFAILGLMLASLGLYGSLAHLVELRRREIGIRIALGAVWQDVVRIVALQGGMVIAGGILMGMVGAMFAGRLVRSQLFGVETYDAATWVTVLAMLLLAAATAAWLPTRRAMRIQPMEALRDE